MIGRAAYQSPYALAEADRLIFGEAAEPKSREQVIADFLPYVERQLAEGVPLKSITRHMLGLFNGLPGARAKGYTETLFGRKTWFPRIKAASQHERQGSERAAINAPIQGTSADLIKRAMARMPAALADAGLSDVAMLLQVHDELVFEAPEEIGRAHV